MWRLGYRLARLTFVRPVGVMSRNTAQVNGFHDVGEGTRITGSKAVMPGDSPMSSEAIPRGSNILNRWIKATTLGWLLGLVLVVVLAMAWDQIAGGAQFMVGVGMGVGVGLMQAHVVEEWVSRTHRWILATTVGMGLPFLCWDIAGAIGVDAFFSLPMCVVEGSLLVGILQSGLLRVRLGRTAWWIPANLVGWGLPTAAIALGDSGLLSGAGAIVSVVAMFFGGAILGAVTGKALISMPKRSPV